MEKRECAQVGISEKLAKLKRWRDHSEWSTRAEAKELGVPRGTLLGWKKELWTKLDYAEFAEAIDGRIRAKTCKPQRKLASYELQILEYHDTCLREDGKVVHGDLVKYGRTIPEFAIRNDGTQLSWISRFMVRYKTESSDRPIPADGDGSDNCFGDSVQNKDEKASSDEEKAPAEEENAPLKKKEGEEGVPEEKEGTPGPLEEKQMPPRGEESAPGGEESTPGGEDATGKEESGPGGEEGIPGEEDVTGREGTAEEPSAQGAPAAQSPKKNFQQKGEWTPKTTFFKYTSPHIQKESAPEEPAHQENVG